MPLFFYLFVLLSIKEFSFDNIWITIVEAHSNIFTVAAQKRDLHGSAEPVIEPGTRACRTATDALIFDLRRTLIEHPNDELRRTLFELRRLLEKV